MEVVDVEVRCALGLGKGKVEEEEGLGRVIEGNPDRGLDLRWRGKDKEYLPRDEPFSNEFNADDASQDRPIHEPSFKLLL